MVVTRSGTGYTIVPGITFSGGAGSGATATATLADADNTITLTLTGTSATFFGTYNGVWNGVNNKCDVATRGTLHLARG